jgi:hypothetical protein
MPPTRPAAAVALLYVAAAATAVGIGEQIPPVLKFGGHTLRLCTEAELRERSGARGCFISLARASGDGRYGGGGSSSGGGGDSSNSNARVAGLGVPKALPLGLAFRRAATPLTVRNVSAAQLARHTGWPRGWVVHMERGVRLVGVGAHSVEGLDYHTTIAILRWSRLPPACTSFRAQTTRA